MFWVDYKYCTSRSVGNYTHGWLVDFGQEKCIKDCDPADGLPCAALEQEDLSAPIYDTVDACCGRFDWIDGGACAASSASTRLAGAPSHQFFADYASGSCRRDCEPGPFGCAVVPPLVALYDSVDACCSVGMFWVDYKYCTSRSVGNYTHGWLVDFGQEKCIKDCDPADGLPCSALETEDQSAPIYDTVEACCGRLDWIDDGACVSNSERKATASLALPSRQFFADYAAGRCRQDCEPGSLECATVPPPMSLYDSIDACCSVGIWWVDYGYCTSRSVGNYTNGWIVDFESEKCIKDCDPADGAPCTELEQEFLHFHIYDTVAACCGRLDWIDSDECASISDGNAAGSLALPSNQFYADYASGSCQRDCEPGPFGCALVPPPVALYDSIEACCSVGQGWVDYRYCTSRSVGNYSNGWVVDYANEKC